MYKRTPGADARQLTCLAIWVVFVLGCLANVRSLLQINLRSRRCSMSRWRSLLMAGLWIGYRVVNLPSFADFLIAVEAEMNKVSWPIAGRAGAQLDRGDRADRSA